MKVTRLKPSKWEDLLPGEGFEVFHTRAALSVLAEHTDGADLVLLGGFKGDQPVALFPLFVRHAPLGVSVVTSPPPGLHVPHLGPILMPTSPKQRKCEKVNETFTSAVFDELGIDGRTLLFVQGSPRYVDPRPYTWQDQQVNVSFTYNLHVGDASPEEVLGAFSKSRRREVRTGRELDLSVERGGVDAARAVYEQTTDRFSEQNEYFGLTWPFVRDLVTALGDRARTYVARTESDEYLGGVIALYSNDSASFWLGGVRATYDNVSINTLLHWAIVEDIAVDPALDSVTRYDMVGAGEHRLSRYKAKFNPELVPYYVIESSGAMMKTAKSAYNALDAVRSRTAGISTVLRATDGR